MAGQGSTKDYITIKTPDNKNSFDIPTSAMENLPWFIHLLAENVGLDYIKFRSKPGLAFPVREVDSIEKTISREDDKNRYTVNVNVGGLDGVSGPLPLWLNKLTLNPDNESLTDFLDIFSHRFIVLLYEAWLKSKPYLSFQKNGKDIFSQILFALLGLRPDQRKRYMNIPDNEDFQPSRMLPYSASLGHRPKSAQGLQGMLRHYFLGIEIKIIEFIKRKVMIPESERAIVRGDSLILGQNIIIGEYLIDIAGKFRVFIGPVEYKIYQEFMPDSENIKNLAKLITMYIGNLLEWDICIQIRGDSIPIQKIETSMPLKLGYNSWLNSTANEDEYIIFELR